jgi:hypothetical protein
VVKKQVLGRKRKRKKKMEGGECIDTMVYVLVQ